MSEIVCPNCQSPQPQTAVFCDNCGHHLAAPPTVMRARPEGAPSPRAPLTPAFLAAEGQSSEADMIVCSACGTSNLPGAHFCDQCGTVIGERSERRVADPQPRLVEQTLPEVVPAPQASNLATHYEVATPARTQISGRLSLDPTGTKLTFPPGLSQINVGREDPVSNVFPEIDLTPFGGEAAGVSRRHARFTLAGGELVLEDLDSTNFTFVNRKRVMPGTQHVVRNGDEIRFGRITTRYEGP